MSTGCWGVVALVLQLLAFVAAARLIPGLRGMIEGNNIAAACMLVGGETLAEIGRSYNVSGWTISRLVP